MEAENLAVLTEQARQARKDVIRMIGLSQTGQIASAFSVLDILVCLYWKVMNFQEENPTAGPRDRLVFGKSQGCAALYAVLAHRGFFSRQNLWSFRRLGGILQGIPDSQHTPGVDATTGIPGLSLGIAAGMALARRIDHSPERVFCVIGDGELQQGGLWESALTASHWGLSNLTLVVDKNALQQGGAEAAARNMAPLADKFQAFGWTVLEAQGHDFQSLLQAFGSSSSGPRVILAHTLRGKGVSFIEKDFKSSESPFSWALAERALEELEKEE